MKITYLTEGVFGSYKGAKASAADKLQKAKNDTVKIANELLNDKIGEIYAEFFKLTENYTIDGSDKYSKNKVPISPKRFLCSRYLNDEAFDFFESPKFNKMAANYMCANTPVREAFMSGTFLIPISMSKNYQTYPRDMESMYKNFSPKCFTNSTMTSFFCSLAGDDVNDAEKPLMTILKKAFDSVDDLPNSITMPNKIQFIIVRPINSFKTRYSEHGDEPGLLDDMVNGTKSDLFAMHENYVNMVSSTTQTSNIINEIYTFFHVQYSNNASQFKQQFAYIKKFIENGKKWIYNFENCFPASKNNTIGEYELRCTAEDLNSPMLPKIAAELVKLPILLKDIVIYPIGSTSGEESYSFYGKDFRSKQNAVTISDAIDRLKEVHNNITRLKSLPQFADTTIDIHSFGAFNSTLLIQLGDKIFDKDSGWAGAKNKQLAAAFQATSNLTVQKNKASKRDIYAWNPSDPNAATQVAAMFAASPKFAGKYKAQVSTLMAAEFVKNFNKLYKLRPQCIAGNDYFFLGDYWGGSMNDDDQILLTTCTFIPQNIASTKSLNLIITITDVFLNKKGQVALSCEYQTKLMIPGGINSKYNVGAGQQNAGKNYEYISGRKFKIVL